MVASTNCHLPSTSYRTLYPARFFGRRGGMLFFTRFLARAAFGFRCPSSIAGSSGRSPQPSVPGVGPEGLMLGCARVGLSPKGLMSSLIGLAILGGMRVDCAMLLSLEFPVSSFHTTGSETRNYNQSCA